MRSCRSCSFYFDAGSRAPDSVHMRGAFCRSARAVRPSSIHVQLETAHVIPGRLWQPEQTCIVASSWSGGMT
jgi:hypothetical protein